MYSWGNLYVIYTLEVTKIATAVKGLTLNTLDA